MISLTSPVETRAHRWPAGFKLAGLCVVTMVLFASDALWFHVTALALTGMLYALPGRLFLRAGAARLWVLWPFVVLIALWHVMLGDVAAGIVIALRMITAVALANLVTMTTRLADMIGVVDWLTTPLRRCGFDTRGISLAIAMVVRFTPVLAQKGQSLAQAWRARSNRRVGWRIVAPFAVLAIDEAEHVAEALRARGGL